MARANPAAKFNRPNLNYKTTPLTRSAFERKTICVLPKSQCDLMDQRNVHMRCSGGNHTHYTRTRVTELVEKHEMRWVDRHHNVATWVESQTWQKTPSGPVHTMQLITGLKGRRIPAGQRA